MIGFIGLGAMGEPMCANLVRSSGQQVMIFDVLAEPMQRLSDMGAAIASDLRSLGAECEVVHLSLPGGPELEAVMRGTGGTDASASHAGLLRSMKPSSTVIDHTTAPYDLTIELGAEAEDHGIRYCDAPVARTRQAAIDGELSVMVGGDIDTFAHVLPLLSCIAADVTHCGPLGAGQATKLLNNVMLVQNLNAVAEAHAIAQGIGLDPAVIFDALSKGSADSFALRSHGHRAILADDYPVGTFPTRYQLKDTNYALELAAEAGVDARGAKLAKERLEAAMEEGLVEEYWPVFRRIIDR